MHRALRSRALTTFSYFVLLLVFNMKRVRRTCAKREKKIFRTHIKFGRFFYPSRDARCLHNVKDSCWQSIPFVGRRNLVGEHPHIHNIKYSKKNSIYSAVVLYNMLRNVEARKRCRPFIALRDYSGADKKFTNIHRIFAKTHKRVQRRALIPAKSSIKTKHSVAVNDILKRLFLFQHNTLQIYIPTIALRSKFLLKFHSFDESRVTARVIARLHNCTLHKSHRKLGISRAAC